MKDSRTWTVAFSHFCDFVQNLPVLLDEGDVEQYHYIIGLFEQALDADLSRFKVTDEQIKRPIQNPVFCWQAKLPGRVERTHFVAQIWNFTRYLESNLHTGPTDNRLN